VTTANGETFTLNRQQLTHAATIITVGGRIDGVGRPGVKIALMAALTESTLRMLTNTGTYPESANYPNDGNGGDHDSLGLFQMRPQSGWGTVAELMDPTYQARAFFGGPTGPNYPSPRGLLDIPGWQQMDPGEAAQAVEVSAYPDRYRNYAPVAESILTALTARQRARRRAGGPVVGVVAGGVPAAGRHLGADLAVRDAHAPDHRRTEAAHRHRLRRPDGTPILAAADGTVTVAEFSGGYGGLIVIEHTIDGQTVATAYAHMWQHGIHVHAGDRVSAGQHIGDVGSSGMSTGAHLHFEVRPGGTNGEAIDAAAWLNQHGAANLPDRDQRITSRLRAAGTQGAPAVSMETPTGSSTIPPATGRSPPGCCTSTSRPSPRSPTPAGAATHRAPAPSPSIPSGGRATSPSATRSANAPTPRSSKPAGGHELDERQRRRARRRVPHLARPNLVRRPRRRGLATLQRRRHARPRRHHRRPLRPPPRHRESRVRDGRLPRLRRPRRHRRPPRRRRRAPDVRPHRRRAHADRLRDRVGHRDRPRQLRHRQQRPNRRPRLGRCRCPRRRRRGLDELAHQPRPTSSRCCW
jgi:hypothetical protein